MGQEWVLLFVYGTLRQGERSHALLAGAHFVRSCRTGPGYRLVDLGEYPAMLPDPVETSSTVAGELYEVPPELLVALDGYEGHPDLFLRQGVILEDGAGVQSYLGRAEDCEGRPVIESGDYRQRPGRGTRSSP